MNECYNYSESEKIIKNTTPIFATCHIDFSNPYILTKTIMQHCKKLENWDERMKLSLVTLKRKNYFDCPDCGYVSKYNKPLPETIECKQCGLTINVKHAINAWLRNENLIPNTPSNEKKEKEGTTLPLNFLTPSKNERQ